MTNEHDHSRPNRAAQLATLHLARAILADDRPAIRRAAIAGGCPSCNAVAAMTFGFALASTLAGERVGVSRELAGVMLATVDAAEGEIRSAGN